MVFGGLLLVKPSFSREKDGFSNDGCSKPSFFSRKRWFRTKKPSFSRETKKQKKKKKKKKTSFPKLWGWGLQKMVFLVFSRKRWFFGSKPSFSRKRWFFSSKPSFSREKDGFEKKMVSSWGLQKIVFFGFLVFLVFLDPPSKNHLLLEKKMVLPGEDLQKPSFSREKDGFEPKKPSFSRENQKKPSFGGPSPIVLEKMFFCFFCCFWFFWFFWFWLVSCFVVFPLIWLGLGCHPRWVHWGGVSIYIYMYMYRVCGVFGV